MKPSNHCPVDVPLQSMCVGIVLNVTSSRIAFSGGNLLGTDLSRASLTEQSRAIYSHTTPLDQAIYV